MRLLSSAPSLDDALVFRDRALLELAYGAGLRVSEWITLGVRDVMLRMASSESSGKGSKERLVPIGRPAIAAVAVYLRELRPSSSAEAGRGAVAECTRRAALTHGAPGGCLRKYVSAAGYQDAR